MDMSPAHVALERVLLNLSKHLDQLASDVHAIEFTVGEELGAGRTPGIDGITRLQRLDFLRQSLEDAALLSLFASRVSEGSLPASTAAKLRLESTRRLLELETVEPSQTDRNGDVDLF